MIEVKGLKKKFNELTVLNGIDIVVERGQVLAIIGPSGSGKSTFLRCLNFLEQPDAGLIEIGEATLNVENYTTKEVQQLRQQTAMVFQNYNLFRNKTVLQNVTEALIVAKKIPKAEAEATGLELLTKVGLKEKAGNYPATLSGGQQQRVSIARALAVNPHAILFDEPTSSLDPELVAEVLQVIKSIADQQTTMIIITHEMDFAREVADHVIFMADGNIVEQGPPESLFGNPQQARTKQFLKQLGNNES
ncbi:amino acid ABC transporter ATP-binding protein [Trichococcus collinsii]|uniref:Amino-acid transport system ATP-binding protein n=1 Tax=Trichococcus collinsii TaxID=157076 RepID=A0AB38A0B4_9LACT|nr:amino acid ABC transporter ATP-binding protein [Trichococcus collinsii]CZQ89318.1 abc transporter [Trichococcus collinsii]SEA48270.1 putative amino-acid transport system ATP-binding protein [Trichococcus collinsii]